MQYIPGRILIGLDSRLGWPDLLLGWEVGLQAYLGFVSLFTVTIVAPYQIAAFFTWLVTFAFS